MPPFRSGTPLCAVECGAILEGLCNGNEEVLQTCLALGVPAHKILLRAYAVWLEKNPNGDFVTFVLEENHKIRLAVTENTDNARR